MSEISVLALWDVRMKTMKDIVFEFIQREMLSNGTSKEGVTTKEIAEALNLQRSNVSTLLNDLVKEEKLEKTATRPVLYKIRNNTTSDYGLSQMKFIGIDGSLSKAIQIAKAAILYPKHSLNVLVTAKAGCGTSFFCNFMYMFCKEAKIMQADAPFIKVNCRHYRNHMDELDNLLFGQEKGKLDNCYFSMAKGGMLFIDNAELLNAHQQSLIFDFLETGMIYSADRKEYMDCKDVYLVLSCNPSHVGQYNQRIPMIIELPQLKDRPLIERFDFVNYFFSIEANNAKRNIEISQEVMQALLLTEYSRNIKELEMEIKKACATACVRVMDVPNSPIVVDLHDFNSNIQKSLVKMRFRSQDILSLVGSQNCFIYDCNGTFQSNHHDELYNEMHMQYKELSNRGINAKAIQDVINNHVTNLFKQYNYNHGYDESYDTEQLSKIVDFRIIELVQKFSEMTKTELKIILKPSVFYGLCLHMNSLLSIKSSHSRVDNDQLNFIVQNYPKEYALSAQFALDFKDMFGIELPPEEIAIITMFLVKTKDEIDNGHPVLLYILHGSGIAEALKEVTISLTHCNNVYSYDLHLEKDNLKAMDEIRSLILKIDEGQGVIVIYDMGSIRTMLDTIAQENDVKIRYIHIPITLIGIDVARKCLQEEDIDYVYHTTLLEMKSLDDNKNYKREVVITLCQTGDGGAFQLKQYIDQYSKLGFKTIPLAISKRDELIKKVMEIKKIYTIHCFVGTYNPNLLGIPYISINKVFENRAEDIDRILMFEPLQSKCMGYSGIYSFLEEQFKFISVSKLKSILPSIVDQLDVVYSLNSEQKIGLFIHIACLLEKCKEGIHFALGKEERQLIDLYEDDYKTISKIIKPLEKNFKVIIDDSQIACIIRIVNKI